MRARLLIEERPPMGVSLLYFRTAPVFGMLLGLLLIVQGPLAFGSRWTPAMLAATHVLALGMLSMCMLGSLWQILPVVCGHAIPRPERVAKAAYHALLCGALALPTAFLSSIRPLFAVAAVALGTAVCITLAACLHWKREQPLAVNRGIRLALLSLMGAMVVGIVLILGYALLPELPLIDLTAIHLSLAGPGWVALLIMGVSFQVLPMFQVTPPYPAWAERGLPPILLGALAASLFVSEARWALAAVLLVYGLTTLALLWKRKRACEASTCFWWLSASCLVLGVLVPDALARGILFLFGFGWSVVNGMLYKIVPFLLWTSWSDAGIPKPIASMRMLLPETAACHQFLLHLATLALLLGACLQPAIAPAAGVLMIFNCAALAHAIHSATRLA